MSERHFLCLLPGLLCDDAAFTEQLSGLSDVADMIVPDLRGFDSLVAMAEHVLAMAPDRFALAGFSMGGRAALQIMRLAPERVSHLCLIDTSAGPEPEGGAKARQPLVDLAWREGMEALANAWLPGLLAKKRRDDEVFQAPLVEMICRSTPDIHEKQVKALVERPDARPLLPAIACPTLVLCGEEDALTTPSVHAEMAAAIAGAQLNVIAGAGHFAPVEEPDAVNAAMRAWLGR